MMRGAATVAMRARKPLRHRRYSLTIAIGGSAASSRTVWIG